MAERLTIQKWNFDDREHLKKLLLLYGYGKWGKIISASKETDMGLAHKRIEEIRAHANAFVRSICDNLTFDKYELKLFLLNTIEEEVDDPYVQVNSKEWDLNLIRQRANPWGKRLQLLYRVRVFVDAFKDWHKSAHGKKPEFIFHYKNLLNYLSSLMLIGQRPSVWWTRQHDIDLIVGTCKFGYANYNSMKTHDEFGFGELEQTCSYQEFPSADTITRRLKKLIQLIVRHEQANGKFDFDAEENDDNELDEFNRSEKKEFFTFLGQYGVGISEDGRYNWHALRERFYSAFPSFTPKSISSIEKIVQYFRVVCQQIIQTDRNRQAALKQSIKREAEPEQESEFEPVQNFKSEGLKIPITVDAEGMSFKMDVEKFSGTKNEEDAGMQNQNFAAAGNEEDVGMQIENENFVGNQNDQESGSDVEIMQTSDQKQQLIVTLENEPADPLVFTLTGNMESSMAEEKLPQVSVQEDDCPDFLKEENSSEKKKPETQIEKLGENESESGKESENEDKMPRGYEGSETNPRNTKRMGKVKCDLGISLTEAKLFHKNTNMLHFVRRYILFGQKTLFKNVADDLTKYIEEMDKSHAAYIADPNYTPYQQDLGLLICVAEHGLGSLNTICKGLYGFDQFSLPYEKLEARVDFLCEWFKNQHDKTNLKKRKVDRNFGNDPKKKYKNMIQKDEMGNIIFPVVISSSLRLQALGKIKTGPFYHSEHNLFPVGYTSVRTYSSIFTKGERAEYTCEIIDGGDKPVYRVTSSEDPEHPIVRDSSTGCWVFICRKVNDLQDQKKQKVTISGTERFGLLEMTIVRLLEGLERADECTKYIFKSKND